MTKLIEVRPLMYYTLRNPDYKMIGKTIALAGHTHIFVAPVELSGADDIKAVMWNKTGIRMTSLTDVATNSELDLMAPVNEDENFDLAQLLGRIVVTSPNHQSDPIQELSVATNIDILFAEQRRLNRQITNITKMISEVRDLVHIATDILAKKT